MTREEPHRAIHLEQRDLAVLAAVGVQRLLDRTEGLEKGQAFCAGHPLVIRAKSVDFEDA